MHDATLFVDFHLALLCSHHLHAEQADSLRSCHILMLCASTVGFHCVHRVLSRRWH